MLFKFPIKKNTVILALGAESAGNFSVYFKNKIFLSEDFGDLLEEKNWEKYRSSVLKYLCKYKIKPKIILTDLHPLYKNTSWGEKLAKKFDAKFIQVQHHHAHIFSAIGDKILHTTSYLLPSTFYGIAMDGTGFGTDGEIWGGEIFKIKIQKTRNKEQEISRIGHLENQGMIGGDAAIREPARMLIGILYNLTYHPEFVSGSKYKVETLKQVQHDKEKKYFIYSFVKKYYTKNEFGLLYSQLQQNFNCQKTSSTGRILDAVSILLGFCGNERNYKHEPIDLLEENSTKPYADLKPKITKNKSGEYILETTPLFEYLLSYLRPYLRAEKISLEKRKRLAATTQLYIAQGLYGIINKGQGTMNKEQNIFLAGGMSNNKIISEHLTSKGAYTSKKVPRGDAGLSFGQIVCYFLTNSRD